jgi:uncharacterized membrane protein
MNELQGKKLARLSWLGLILWHITWLALLPVPYGKENLVIAVIIIAPLLLPLFGILKLRARSLIWGGYMAFFLAMFGMVELWADPPERPAALVQLLLCTLYLIGLTFGTRKRR